MEATVTNETKTTMGGRRSMPASRSETRSDLRRTRSSVGRSRRRRRQRASLGAAASVAALLLLLQATMPQAGAFRGAAVGGAPLTRSSVPGPSRLHSWGPPAREDEGVGSRPAVAPARRPALVRGLRDLLVEDNYDALLLDMWGVLHDGTQPYPGVLDAIRQLRSQDSARKKRPRLIVLSNSSKRRDYSLKMLRKLGFDPDRDFDAIVTSGEVAHQMLRQASGCKGEDDGEDDWLRHCEPWQPLARLSQTAAASSPSPLRAFCLGSGDGDAEYLASCGWDLAPAISADLVVARGTFTVDVGSATSGSPTVQKKFDRDGYEAAVRDGLQAAAQRHLPMLVCNPDKIRPDADRSPMPGMLGDRYEALLRDVVGKQEAEALVKRVGKPDRDVYDIALGIKGQELIQRHRACMVGDALETDVTGGSAAGIDTVWVLLDGVHAPELASFEGSLEDGAQSVLEAFNRQTGTYAKGRLLTPTYTMPSFQW